MSTLADAPFAENGLLAIATRSTAGSIIATSRFQFFCRFPRSLRRRFATRRGRPRELGDSTGVYTRHPRASLQRGGFPARCTLHFCRLTVVSLFYVSLSLPMDKQSHFAKLASVRRRACSFASCLSGVYCIHASYSGSTAAYKL